MEAELKEPEAKEEETDVKAGETAEAEEVAAEEGTSKDTRLLVAIGDLHGDYYRLERLLRENDLILPGTMAWNPEASQVDLVLIGDYVDWRNEPLEGPQAEWVQGAKRILDSLYALHFQLESLREQNDNFDSHLYTILGNHDEMMIEAHSVFAFMEMDRLEDFLASVGQNRHVRQAIAGLDLEQAEIERLLKFLNWYVQGGQATVEGYGSLLKWKEAMDTEMGDFLKRYLRLGVVINDRLYAHTAPDPRHFWLPIDEIMNLPGDQYKLAKESFLWSRKIWGYDYCTGSRTVPFTPEEMDEMLSGLGVKGVVVGHTPLPHDGKPVVAYEGRVINIDLHAFPGSEAFIERYVPESEKSTPLRDPALGR